MIKFNAMISRARLGFLFGVLAVTAVLGAVLQALSDVWAGVALMFGILVLCIFLLVGHLEIITTPRVGIRPADETGTAFELPDVSRSPLLLAGSLTIFFGSVVLSRRISDLVQGDNAWLDDVWQWPSTLVIVGLLVALWFTALRPSGVRLGTDGVLVRRSLGSSFVPWDALTPDSMTVILHPAPRSHLMPPMVRLSPAFPELVRRTGRTGRRGSDLVLVSTDPDRLAWILRHYASHPDARPAIGTAAELARVTA